MNLNGPLIHITTGIGEGSSAMASVVSKWNLSGLKNDGPEPSIYVMTALV
jgi:hypothetical protein